MIFNSSKVSLVLGLLLNIGAAAYLTVEANVLIPDYYSESGIPSTRNLAQEFPHETIDPFTGGLQLHHVDMVVPGNGGMDIKIERHYRSLSSGFYSNSSGLTSNRTPIGVGWDLHFGRIVFDAQLTLCKTNRVASDRSPVLELPDGSARILADADSAKPYDLVTKDLWIAKCVANAPPVVYSPDGYIYTFGHKIDLAEYSKAYAVTQITDPNGNWMKVEYLSSGFNKTTMVKKITTKDGRLVSFNYSDDNPSNINTSAAIGATSNALLTSISSGGKTVNYNHIPSSVNYYHFLSSVRMPNGKSWDYKYETQNKIGQNSLIKFTTPKNMVAEYTYLGFYFYPDNDHYKSVVSSKKHTRSNQPTKTWTYGYSANSNYDETTVKTPFSCEKYRHYGPRSADIGTVWRVGNLIKKSIFSNSTNCTNLIQEESYVWGGLKVSSQNLLQRSLYVQADVDTNAPLLLSKTITRDGTNYTTTYSNHDIYGNPKKIVESGQSNKTTDYTYSNNTSRWILGQTLTEKISGLAGSTGLTSRSYSSTGNLLSETKYGVATNYTYHSTGDLNTSTDALGNTTQFSNYYRGVARQENLPEGVILSRIVDYFGNVTSQTDGENNTTGFVFDSMNRVTLITTPKSTDNNITILWDDVSTPKKRTLSRGSFAETLKYNELGSVISQEAEGVTINTEYDVLERKTFVSNPNSSQGQSFQYDALNRPVRTTHADASYIAYQYLSQNRVRITDEEGNITTYSYRSFGNPDEKVLIEIAAPENVTTSITRNLLNNITTITQGLYTRTYGYNSHNYLSSTTNPETGTTLLGRDILGNLTSKQVGSSEVTQYYYDDLNRLELTDFPENQIPSPDETRSYDQNNNLKTLEKGAITWSYLYDANKNLLEEKLGYDNSAGDSLYYGAGSSDTINYAYNGKDQLSNMTYPSGLVVDYNPDDLGRPTKVGGFASQVTYFPNGQIKKIVFANGKSSRYLQNSRLFPTKITTDGLAETLIDLTYVYDASGNVLQINDTVDSANNRSFTYDELHRLKTASGTWGAGSISYDETGNITSKLMGGQQLNYSYNTSNHRLSSVSGYRAYNYGYDVYGNIDDNGLNTFTYGADGNLLDVGGQSSIQYRYDGNKNRVLTYKVGDHSRSLYNLSGKLLYKKDIELGIASDYVYVQNQLIARRDVCEDQDSDLDGIPNCIVQAAETTIYYHNDLLGSPVASTNEAGNLVWKETYKPYGERVINDPESADNALWYTGKVHDGETGLSYFGARYYDPIVGRFMAIDPVGFQESNPISFNRYAYANNNPYKFVDPDGELPIVLLAFAAYDFYNAYQETGSIGQAAGATILGSINPLGKVSKLVKGVKASKGGGKSVKEGIYEFTDTAGKKYCGQSCNIPNRLKSHIKSGKLDANQSVSKTEVLGGKTAREIAEHRRIQGITGGVPARFSDKVSNKVDPIGPKRSHLLND